jgi:hypothetical protein
MPRNRLHLLLSELFLFRNIQLPYDVICQRITSNFILLRQIIREKVSRQICGVYYLYLRKEIGFSFTLNLFDLDIYLSCFSYEWNRPRDYMNTNAQRVPLEHRCGLDRSVLRRPAAYSLKPATKKTNF